MKAREELNQSIRETMRSRAMLKLVREVYRLGDFGGAEADVDRVVLEIVVENAVCDRAMLLSVVPGGEAHRFRVLSTKGIPDPDSIGREITILRPLRYCYTTGDDKREGQTAKLCNFIGLPYILWCHDPNGAVAILLGNHQESNASHPFDEADQELVETALSVYLDILHRKRENRRLERTFASLDQNDALIDVSQEANDSAPDIGGIQEGEIRQSMAEGGRLTGLFVVDRSAANGPDFVCYIRGSWSPGYRLLRTFRGRSARAYRDVSRLLHTARYEFDYSAPIVIYAAGAPELRRFPGVWPNDLSPYGERHVSQSIQPIYVNQEDDSR